MRLVLSILFVILFGYLIGSINISYFMGRMRGYDIRKEGSGNAGASNVVIMMGKKIGLIVALLDIFKAFLVCTIVIKLFPDIVYMGPIAGVACILGHIFPFYMQFKGGKGLATLGGTILALDPKLFIILLSISIILAVVVNYIAVVPMSMSIIFAVLYGYTRKSLISFFILMIAAVVMNYKHIDNVKRILAGTEARFSLLWDREGEAIRLNKTYDGGKGYDQVEERVNE